jgi:hypothetical protein
MIQRYEQDVYGIILKDPDGQIVLWDDHRAAITPLVRALRDIRMSNAGTEQRKRGWNAAYELLERPEYKEAANG